MLGRVTVDKHNSFNLAKNTKCLFIKLFWNSFKVDTYIYICIMFIFIHSLGNLNHYNDSLMVSQYPSEPLYMKLSATRLHNSISAFSQIFQHLFLLRYEGVSATDLILLFQCNFQMNH